jgi:hypothetical protein
MNDQIKQDREAQKRQAEKDAERGGRDSKAERNDTVPERAPAASRRGRVQSEGVESSAVDDDARNASEDPVEGK